VDRASTRLRRRLAQPELVVAPACFDPLSARIAAELGFECLALGGYALGAHLAVSEPLLSFAEVLASARQIVSTVDLPLIVDAGAGFGDPLHTMRTVREFEAAGVAGIHIEDQVFPKRAHYHRDYREHLIPAEEMSLKIRYGCQARRDPDFLIIARTDSMRTHGYEEGIRRAGLYAQAGADLIMLFPNTADEARRAPRDCPAPLVYVNSLGNRVGRPVFSTAELAGMGYRLSYDAIGPIMASYRAVRDLLTSLRQTGVSMHDDADAISIRQAIEHTIGLEEFYRIEEDTVEPPSS
jgi:2-methylisocitrate lyase-like PEP mutase family enzyme